MDNELVQAVLAHNGVEASGEDDVEAHYDSMADELIAAVHSKDKQSVKTLLRLLSEK